MKKVSKKISKITKVFLVFAIIFSNLTCLKTVFAYEENNDFELTLNEEENKINVKYLETLEEEVNYTLEACEDYVYLDETKEHNCSSKSITGVELNQGTEIELDILDKIEFDGEYKFSIILTDEESRVIGESELDKKIEFGKGLKYHVYNNILEEIALENGMYSIENSNFTIHTELEMGGLAPTDNYFINEVEYSGTDLLNYLEEKEYDLDGHLYGKHEIIIPITIYNSEGEIIRENNEPITIMYGSYEDNDNILNSDVNYPELKFETNDDEGNGTLYIIESEESVSTVSEMKDFLDNMTEGIITYQILDELGNEINLEEETDIELVNDMLIVLSCQDTNISYKIVFVTNDYIDDLIEESLNSGDKNILDVNYFNEALNEKNWDITSNEDYEGTLKAKLEKKDSNITTGDEFTIDYIVSLKDYELNGIEGIINYDKNKLELISVNSLDTMKGNVLNDRFMYLFNTKLSGEEVIDEVDTPYYNEVDYVVLNIKFKALSYGETEVGITDYVFVDGINELTLTDDEITLPIIINASNDNNLSSLFINEEEILLEENVLEYSINVPNEVTELNVETELSNVGAVSVIESPVELAVGNNVVRITVTAENGDVKIYTINVIREEAKETEVTPVNNNVTYEEDTNKEDDNNPTIDINPSSSEPEEIEKEKSNSNISKIIIIILIILVIAGLIYLIFKDDDDEETKKANKEVDKLKKDNSKKIIEPIVNKPKKENKEIKDENKKRKDPRDNKK